jgi:integrase
MATIRKRGESYQIRVSCGYDINGNQVERSMTWKPDKKMTEKQIQKELNRVMVKFEEDCSNGCVSLSVKFEDFAEQWFKEYAEIKLKPKTIEGYRWMSKRIYKAIGHLKLNKITPRDIQKFILEMTEEKRCDGRNKRNGKLSSKTIKLHISMISTIFDYALKMQLIQNNPCRAVTLPKPDSEKREVYTLEEIQQLLELFQKEPQENFKYVLFYTLAIYTGFRRGELLGLEWKDFDFDNNMVTVNRTSLYSKSQGGTYTETPKTETSYRTLKLPVEVIEALFHWKDLQDKQRIKVGTKWQETDRIFTKWNGLPLDGTAPGYFFKRFCERTGMKYVCNHSFRHFNASVLISNGVDVKTVQSCLGHSTPTTTLSIYCHSFQSAQVRAMDSLAEKINLRKDGKTDKMNDAS